MMNINCIKSKSVSRFSYAIIFIVAFLASVQWNSTFAQNVQNIRVAGIVMDENEEPLIGATVQMVGSTMGTVTDLDGKFIFRSIPSTAVLKVSYVGYKEKTVKIKGQKFLKIEMSTDEELLEEVVVIGYGSMKKRDITGAITSVTAQSIAEKQPVDIFDALQGEAPGVMIISNSGAPGEESSVRVRGTSTFEGGVNPLYVVDGVQMEDISSINPNDIQSMEILKDAASASIYGSRSANGVIIITTKQGEAGKVKVNGRYLFSVSDISNKIDQANAWERAIYESFYNKKQMLYTPFAEDPNNVNYGGNIDYQDAITRAAIKQQVDLSISSATQSTKYFTSLSYLNDEGIVLNTYNKRMTFRTSIDYKANDKLNFITNVSYTYNDKNRLNETAALQNALKRPPQFALFNPDGSFIYDNSGMKNPIAEAELRINRPITHSIIVNETAKYTVNKYLTAQLNVNGNFSIARTERFNSGLLDTKNGIASGGDDTYIKRNFTTEFILSYSRRILAHNFSWMAGTSIQDWKDESMIYDGTRYVSEQVHTTNSIQLYNLSKTKTDATAHSMASFFGRVGYNYKGRYLFNANFRADGSSRFVNNRWGYFPSVSVGWRFSDEKFMNFAKSVMNDAKFRASWGVTGNERIKDYDSQISYGFGTNYYNGISGVRPFSNIGNPDIRWEQTSQINLGLDLSFFRNRIKVSLDYYNKYTDGLLYSMNMPLETGYSTMRVNMGSIRNTGYELTVTGDVIRANDFKWRSSINFSINENEILSLGSEDYVADGGWLVAVGQPIGQFYGYKAMGVYKYDESNAYTPDFKTQLLPVFERDANNNVILSSSGKPTVLGYTYPDGTPFEGTPSKMKYASTTLKGGDVIWDDIDNNGIIDDKDRQILGNGLPKTFASWNNTFYWRNIALTMNFYGSFGNEIYNAFRQSLTTAGNQFITPEPYEIFNAWNRPGIVTDVPIMDKGRSPYNQDLKINTLNMESGDFIRLKTVRLAYTFTKKNFKNLPVEELGIWGYANNLFTWTNYSGFDPELGGQNVLTPGNDPGKFPRKREFGFGLNVTL